MTRLSHSSGARYSSPFSQALEPLAAGLWVFFVLVSLVAGVVWAFGLGDAQLALLVRQRDLLLTLQWLLPWLDFGWITLAAANVYVCLATREGLGTARRWSLGILLTVTVLGWISVRTGVPLGPIQYGLPLGPLQIGGVPIARLGPVPLGLALFWFAVIMGAREGLLRFFPRWSHGQIALGTGVLGALTDLSLEPLAAKLRGFWCWRAEVLGLPPIFDAPLTGCFMWGVVAGLLAFPLREKNVVASARPRSWQPAATLAIFHAVFLAAHLGRWVRG
jgi:uncharacterized membrane protein